METNAPFNPTRRTAPNESSMAAMETATANISPTKRKRQPRNSACQPCAALKMKCVAGPLLGKCERCNRMNRDCLPSIPKPRKRRAFVDAEMPVHITTSSVHRSSNSAGNDTTAKQSQDAPSEDMRHSLLTNPDLTNTESNSFLKLLSRGLRINEATSDLLQGIDYHYVENCLTAFRPFTKNFPFVVLHPDTDAASMAADRPVTTVALCAVASGSHPDIRIRLVRSFRLALSTMVLVEGQRNIDLSIGLLVFLAWNHHYMAKHQIYQELCLLAGMATDMGMYCENLASNIPRSPSMIERFRTYLGCYYLCCSLSTIGFNKPNPLRWTDNLRKYAEIVGQFSDMQSDRMLVGIIELVKSIDDFEDSIQAPGIESLRISTQYLTMQARAANNRLSTLKREHPEIASLLTFNGLSTHIIHRLVRASCVPDMGCFIQCAFTIKEYTEDLLARPAATLYRIAIVDWVNLLEILLLMARLTTRLPSNVTWEAGAISSILQPDAILDRIYSHTTSASSEDFLNPRDEAQLLWLRNLCETIKTRILGCRERGRQRVGLQFDPVHSLDNREVSAHLEGRFRPVNEPYSSELSPPSASSPSRAHINPETSEFLGSSDHGVLEDPILKAFVIE